MVQMRAIYQACLIIAECSPLKTVSVRQSREGVKISTHNFPLISIERAIHPGCSLFVFYLMTKEQNEHKLSECQKINREKRGMRSKLSICRVVERSDRGNNGANECNISSLLDYCRVQPIEDRVSTAKPGGG